MATIALLSWKAPVTLRRTLASYAKAKLLENTKENFIFFNARSAEDDAIAAEFGWRAEGNADNLGIWGGMDAIANLSSERNILFLQNDCPIAVDAAETANYLQEAEELLNSGRADIVRLRHRFNQGNGVGWQKFLRFHFVHELDERYNLYDNPKLPKTAFSDTIGRKIMRLLHPSGAMRRIDGKLHLERDPEKWLQRWVKRDGHFFIVDSAITNFSEQPFMISRRFYQELSDWGKANFRHKKLNGFPILEQTLNCRWWRSRHFRIAICDEGVFTHARWDDSFRAEHSAFNKDLVISKH